MKNLFSFLLVGSLFLLVGCGKDGDCVKCEINAIFTTITTEACEDGDDLKVTTEALGIKSDTTFKNKTLDSFKSESIADGYTCK
ncbi:MAG TPA: hypothetical protein PKD51_13160 [Saprospiraceae bacterium]|nr:hypothetical protein [Saprospiraceae bacterium]HMU05266.1 hypothetical protein [Saprospiraceae bacterium]